MTQWSHKNTSWTEDSHKVFPKSTTENFVKFMVRVRPNTPDRFQSHTVQMILLVPVTVLDGLLTTLWLRTAGQSNEVFQPFEFTNSQSLVLQFGSIV